MKQNDAPVEVPVIALSARRRTANALRPLLQYRDPGDVVDAVVMALFGPQPKRRYLVVKNQDEACKTIAKQIEMLVELNEGHVYTYTGPRSLPCSMLRFSNRSPTNGCEITI